ncbi:parallel beta-helix repeat (two copies) [Methanobrevibacter millerae]|uniref:Parallel beta-helix repeat (Two copies) n=2 Tax=Methanobrevibacter millerae TaxID=230361 RepID=A0A1G5X0X5_9EURY|nr:parallel beta-helix repeat (two copies) [Methanobrevibacter millerae]
MILILLLLVFVSLGAVSAADDANETLAINEISDDGGEILCAEYTVTPSNYNQYFSSKGELIDSKVSAGDTITLSGEFSSKNFTVTKNITLQGSGATIKNGIVKLTKTASGSVIRDLKIINVGDKLQGIYINGATNCLIDNNVINNTGISSYPICLNEGSDFNNITNNVLQTMGAAYGHGTRSTSIIVLGSADNNYIAGNTLYCDDANGIYLSSFAGGDFKGGESYNNYIYNNDIYYLVNTTSWAYAIQMMGGNNTADSNRIYKAYRGISSSNFPSNKAINNVIYVAGTDFSTHAVTGGDYGIALASNATIRNNTINGMFVGAGISAGDGSVIENNFINATKGYGMDISANDVVIRENEIYTTASAGIHQQGKYEGIVVDRNVIVSDSGIGVLLSKASKTKYPSKITITGNNITTSNEYIINAADADKNSWVIKDNAGTGKIMTPAGEVDPSVPDFVFNGTTHVITPANYHNFIDTDGNLKNDFVSDGDILLFNGTFDNKEILLSLSVKVTADNATFNNSTFIVTSDSVWIENLTIVNRGAERYNAWAIFVADTQIVKITNNNIVVFDPAAAYAIYVFQSSKVYVDNNVLMSHGESLTYTLLGYGAENCEFVNNTVSCIGTGQIHSFEDARDINANDSETCIGVCIGHCLGDVLQYHCLDGTNIVPEIYRTYGILMIKSSNNTVDSNDVYVSSLVNESLVVNSTNSLVGIDFYYDCDNNVISNNKILVEGNDNYLYGAGAIAYPTGQPGSSTAVNNKFIANNITVNGFNVVEGLIFGQGCADTLVKDNNINLSVDYTAYGITLEMSGKSTIENNVINMDAGAGYGIEAYDSDNNTIKNNIISGVGKIISGIAGINADNNVIKDNEITSNGTGENLGFILKDSVKADNSGIFLAGKSTNNEITYNAITTAEGYPVYLSNESTGNTVTDNYLKGAEGSGDAGVTNPSANTVKDNYAADFKNATMEDATAEYLGSFDIVLNCDVEGAEVLFTLDNLIIANTTTNGTQTVVSYKLNKNTNVGNYTLKATLSKEGYKTEVVTANLEITKANFTVNVDDVTAKAGSKVPLVATVITAANDTLAGIEVKFYRNAQYVGSNKTDDNGIATFLSTIPAGLNDGNYTILAVISESDNYVQNSGDGVLTVSKDAKEFTQIEASDVVMYVKDGTRFVGTLKDMNGNPIANVNVTTTINGVTRQRLTNSSGQFSFALGLNSGEYPVELVFEGNDKYEACSANATVTIKSAVQGNDIVMMYKDGTRYYAAVLVDGKPVSDETLRFNINGVFYERTTNAAGTASLAINLNPGNYTITAERVKTGEMASNQIVINPLIVENHDIEMYYKNGTGYTVKIIKQDGTVAKAGEVVTFNINGVFYNRTTNDEGIARLNLNLEPGQYIITAEYKGLMASNNITIKPVLNATDLTKSYSEKKAFEVSLVDGQGKALPNTNVTFNINGVFYTRTTDDSGIARLNINLMAGEYIITSSYNGANIANKVTVTP